MKDARMEKFHRPRKILIVLILIATGGLAYWTSIRMKQALLQRTAARNTVVDTLEVISRLKDAETGQRGFLLTGSEAYLAPYRSAVTDIPVLMDHMARALGPDRALNSDFRPLRSLSEEKLAELARTTQLFREQGIDAALEVVQMHAGKEAMDDIREVAERMAAREEELVQARNRSVVSSIALSLWLTLFGLTCLLAMILFLERTVGLEIRERRRVAETLDKAHVIMCGLDGTIFYWNSAAEEIYGWTQEEAVGRRVDELLCAEFPKPFEEIRADLLKTGSWAGDIRQRRKDGSAIWASSHWSLQYDAKGVPFSLIKMNNDITEWKQSVEALRSSEATVRSLFENASQGILMVDREGRIVDSNATMERLFGYSRAELLDAPVEMLLPKSYRASHKEHRAGYALAPRTREVGNGLDLAALRKDGSEFPVDISLSFVKESKNGQLAVAFISDVTVRKQADRLREDLIARLEEALAEREVLLKEVHHRVKNNMAVIVGLLGMQARAGGDERLTAALEQSQQRVASMALIHEFLYAGENLNSVNFGEYLKQLAAEVCTANAVDFDPARLTIETEEIQLPVHRAIPCGLIINELLSNAIKYAFTDGRKGHIHIGFMRLEMGMLRLTCEDGGVGIPPSLDWRNASSTGLKIVQILTRQLHGDLTMDGSKGGTRFDLAFSSQGDRH